MLNYLAGFSPPRTNEEPGGLRVKNHAYVRIPQSVDAQKVELVLSANPSLDKDVSIDVFLNQHFLKRLYLNKKNKYVFEITQPLPHKKPRFLRFKLRGVFWSGILAYLSRCLRSWPLPTSWLKQLEKIRQHRVAQSIRVYQVVWGNTPILDTSHAYHPYLPLATLSNCDTGINIIGALKHEFGIGESARASARAAEAVGLSFNLIPITLACEARGQDTSWANRLTHSHSHPVNLFHANADQMPMVRKNFPARFFKSHYNIGYWAWELGEFPDWWMERFSGLNEIWVPSKFVFDAIHPKSPLPVHVMPHAVDVQAPKTTDRAALGLPKDCCLFLCLFDLASSRARKNPDAVIEAFQKAFAHSKDVHLAIKVQNEHAYPSEFKTLQEKIGGDPKISLLEKTWSREKITALQACCDVFVSLHRSEGFGLALAECMSLGKPVIATHWSGNMDFMNKENSCLVDYQLVRLKQSFGPYMEGQLWAEPSAEHAAIWMKRLADDASLRKRIGLEALSCIRHQLAPAVIGERYVKRLQTIAWFL